MTDLERTWREKTDVELEDARNSLAGFTPEGRRVIEAELTRRGMSLAPDSPELHAAWADTEQKADESDGEPGAVDPLACVRCETPLDYVGTRNFHEGANWGALGELGELFVKKERFDVYVCPRCGRVEFFVDGIGEERRPG